VPKKRIRAPRAGVLSLTRRVTAVGERPAGGVGDGLGEGGGGGSPGGGALALTVTVPLMNECSAQ
jgi:hypothetical protein